MYRTASIISGLFGFEKMAYILDSDDWDMPASQGILAGWIFSSEEYAPMKLF